jgi:hypothetical protein
MRSSASLAMGEPVAAWTSKNLRRTCAQQPASTISRHTIFPRCIHTVATSETGNAEFPDDRRDDQQQPCEVRIRLPPSGESRELPCCAIGLVAPARRAQIDGDGRWTIKRGRRGGPPNQCCVLVHREDRNTTTLWHSADISYRNVSSSALAVYPASPNGRVGVLKSLWLSNAQAP